MTTEDTKKETKTHDKEKQKYETTESFEYLFVISENSLTQKEPVLASELPKDTNEAYTKEWVHTWFIYWPNTDKPEKRIDRRRKLSALINEFGADGWKLIINNVTHTAIIRGDDLGLDEMGSPIGQEYIFIRRRQA